LKRFMKVKVHFFSYLREYLPPQSSARGELELWLPDQSSLKDMFIALGFDRRLGKEIFDAEVGHTFQVLINQVAVHDYAHALADGDEIVLFPPMAGG
jgi:molybdopterin converting factor small subunit